MSEVCHVPTAERNALQCLVGYRHAVGSNYIYMCGCVSRRIVSRVSDSLLQAD